MILEILEISKFGRMKLLDENGKKHALDIEFRDLPRAVRVGDTIEMDEHLLDKHHEAYCGQYAFGAITSEFGNKIESFQDIDCVLLNLDGKEIFLKRIYG